MEENKEPRISLNIADLNQIKAFYGKTTEDLVRIIDKNRDKISTCPDYCELKEFFEDVYSK